MEIKIKNAETTVKKTVHKSGVIFGMKKWAGKKVIVIILENGAEGDIEGVFANDW